VGDRVEDSAGDTVGEMVADSVVDLNPKAYPAIADELSLRLQRELAEDAFSEVYLAYNRYKSVLSQDPTIERILPMQLEVPATPEGEVVEGVDFLF
jgi:F0F1-type ATP synthase gamma subunit